MNAADIELPSMDSPDELRALGFTGFRTVASLREESAASVPATAGVWVVIRDAASVPHFLPRSTGAEWRGMDPTETPDALAARWVPRACVMYVAEATGPGVRALLQQRIKRFLRFGAGRNVAHWSGRYVWQLAGASALRLAWWPMRPAEARTTAKRLLDAFVARHGMPPFAQDAGDDEA